MNQWEISHIQWEWNNIWRSHHDSWKKFVALSAIAKTLVKAQSTHPYVCPIQPAKISNEFKWSYNSFKMVCVLSIIDHSLPPRWRRITIFRSHSTVRIYWEIIPFYILFFVNWSEKKRIGLSIRWNALQNNNSFLSAQTVAYIIVIFHSSTDQIKVKNWGCLSFHATFCG